MSTLFNNNNAEGGFRLRNLEIYNWGTFNGKVFQVKPDGRTSLLTGANGSGKTTLIDALLTLIVPSHKRFYNQSSGAEIKKERDENSYFWGYYGKTFSEAEGRSNTEQLRNKADNPYSVLLACFQNTGTLHTITLVQVRWYSNGSLKKVFIVSPYQLNITEHFGKGNFDIKGDWKKKLVKQFQRTEIYDSFKDYAARFSDLFGLKDKALSLFNQTVGIKVLGDLTNFIRQEMLEEADGEEQFKSLFNHYSDLLISHKAIQKDEKQLELLEPIIKNKAELISVKLKKSTLDFIEEQMPFYLGKIEYDLLDSHIQKIEEQTETVQQEEKLIRAEVESLETAKDQLVAQRAAMNIDSQISILKKDIEAETEKRNAKNQQYTHYTKLAATLNLNTEVDEEAFTENKNKIQSLSKSLQQEADSLTERKVRYKIESESIEHNVKRLQEQITSLLSRNNRLPDDLVAARKRLVDILEVSEDEIPFAGELLKVKPAEKNWEDCIERLLHGFSMQLLVPEKYSRQVNQFIHANDMKTKIVYHKIDRRPPTNFMRWPTEDDALVNKLEIKESDHSKWLENYLLDRFNYHCTDDLEVFYGSHKAITSNGLIRNVNRHEKDDRPGVWKKTKYQLGWDNRATIQYLQQEKINEEKEYGKITSEMEKIKPLLSNLTNKIQTINQLDLVKHFDEINWKKHTEKINLLTNQVDELKKSSNAYQTILDQIERTEKELDVSGKKRDEVIRRLTKLDNDFTQSNFKKLKIKFEELTENGITIIEQFLKDESLNRDKINNLDQLEQFATQAALKHKGKSRAAGNAVSKIELDTTELVGKFVSPGEKITNEFANWSGDVINIKADLTSLEDLEDLYKNIQTQRLVEHKKRFREYMDKSMLDALTSYRTWLYNEEEKIKDMIEELNVPLKKITFNKNPDTYLQLECRGLRGENEINIFKEQLGKSIPNALEFATQNNETYRNEVFEKIKELITGLQKEELRRKKVTDVRNWRMFSAREYSVVENKAGQYHDNTASYSGGQKAQFTYAILGAAIAHQFGIFQQGKQHKSLRFITVDEAFSKLDPEKSQFLMEFCAQLNLQILVVTPLDKINIAEPYINAVHFVEIKNKRSSVVYNLTMDEYYERKEEFKQLAENAK